VKLINDAAMQALGGYQGGRMLFLGLGTGLGTTLIVDGHTIGLELGHLPYRKERSYEDYVGEAGMERRGKAKWVATVFDVVERLKEAFIADYVLLGGGNVKKLEELPPGARRGDNADAMIGGVRLWQDQKRP
jgi:polyphosphate glucokinase